MKASLLDPSRSWVWKTALFAIPGSLALGQFGRPNHVSLTLFVITFTAIGGTSIALGALWHEHRRWAKLKSAQESYSKFQAATETSLDAFSLLQSVRDDTGKIADFRILYVNVPTEHLFGRPRTELVGQTLCSVLPLLSKGSAFVKFCNVVETGKPLNEEFAVSSQRIKASWLRTQVIKLGDGLAITCSDISEPKTNQAKDRTLAEFAASVFQNAPCSIIATDANGLITAMNTAAETLSGYQREELVGKASLTVLHDERELLGKAVGLNLPSNIARDGFKILTAEAETGQMHEQEWTLIRQDGTKTPINLAVRAVISNTGRITGFVSIAVDITDRRQMMEYVTHLATHDPLTRLTGRSLLQDKVVQAVDEARRFGTKVAVFMIDLDHFKRINDSLGHTAGDQILIEAAKRLRDSVRSTDVVARMSGDEFVVVMPDITNVDDVEQCAANLVSKLASEISVDGYLVNVTASVGVSIFPDVATDAKHLLKRADSAMYAAKESGRNQHQIFSEGMLKETAERLTMEHALRHALANGELSMHYQPQISLTTGAVTGMEALLRWVHPKLGEIPPAQFIPLAEETGLILSIGEWTVRTACREGKALQDELGMDLTVSVNLSPRQFQQKNLIQVVENALLTSGLPARNLEVEITENMLMVNSGDNLDKLQKMRELGIHISIDDFGTGFCSFSYLLQYQVDRLKIDQSFVKKAVTDTNAAAVVRTIIAMSHGLNIKVVAEGVETDEQLRFLLRRKCDDAQGYFIAKPVAPHEFCDLVRAYAEGAALVQHA